MRLQIVKKSKLNKRRLNPMTATAKKVVKKAAKKVVKKAAKKPVAKKKVAAKKPVAKKKVVKKAAKK